MVSRQPLAGFCLRRQYIHAPVCTVANLLIHWESLKLSLSKRDSVQELLIK